MMISRRFFVFGSVAAVTAAAIPLEMPDSLVSRAVFSKRFNFRRISTIAIDFEPQPPGISELAAIEFKRPGAEFSIFNIGMNVRGCYLWRAIDDAQIIVSNQALIMSCEPAFDGCHIDMIYNAERDLKKPARLFSEGFRTVSGDFVPAYEPQPLDLADQEFAA